MIVNYSYKVLYSESEVKARIESFQRDYTVVQVSVDHSRTPNGSISFGVLICYEER